MSYPPPPPAPGYSESLLHEPRRISGLAVASLVFSLILCIPLFTQIVGILLGIGGVVVGGKPNRSGRGVALAGIVIGLIGLAAWSYGGYVLYNSFLRPVTLSAEFAKHLAKGENAEAAALTAPPFDPNAIPALAEKLQVLGKFRAFDEPGHPGQPAKTNPFQRKTVNGVTTYALHGTFVFENGRQIGDLAVTQTPQGWRITRCTLNDEPGSTSLPTTKSATAETPESPTPPTAPAAPEKP